MADRLLDCQPFNVKEGPVSWESSTLRSWLNSYPVEENGAGIDYRGKGFLDTAFTAAQREAVLRSAVANRPNGMYCTDCGNPTEDYVFLLSNDEVFSSPAAARNCLSMTVRRSTGSAVVTISRTGPNSSSPQITHCTKASGKKQENGEASSGSPAPPVIPMTTWFMWMNPAICTTAGSWSPARMPPSFRRWSLTWIHLYMSMRGPIRSGDSDCPILCMHACESLLIHI